MPPRKVCPQCQAVVPLRLKVCRPYQHVFRSKRKVECNLPDQAIKCKRASESCERTLRRKQQNRQHMACVRPTKKTSNVSIQQAIISFHSDIKNGLDFVCTCCHRLMYSKRVGEKDVGILEASKSYQLNRLEIRTYMGKTHLSFPSIVSFDEINLLQNVNTSDEDEDNLCSVSIVGVKEQFTPA